MTDQEQSFKEKRIALTLLVIYFVRKNGIFPNTLAAIIKSNVDTPRTFDQVKQDLRNLLSNGHVRTIDHTLEFFRRVSNRPDLIFEVKPPPLSDDQAHPQELDEDHDDENENNNDGTSAARSAKIKEASLGPVIPQYISHIIQYLFDIAPPTSSFETELVKLFSKIRGSSSPANIIRRYCGSWHLVRFADDPSGPLGGFGQERYGGQDHLVAYSVMQIVEKDGTPHFTIKYRVEHPGENDNVRSAAGIICSTEGHSHMVFQGYDSRLSFPLDIIATQTGGGENDLEQTFQGIIRRKNDGDAGHVIFSRLSFVRARDPLAFDKSSDTVGVYSESEFRVKFASEPRLFTALQRSRNSISREGHAPLIGL